MNDNRCPNCGAAVNASDAFCISCGKAIPAPAPQPAPQPAAPMNINYSPNYTAPVTADQLPPQFRPLSPWAYWGLTLLYGVPIVGLVFLIVFSFSKGNINRRNFSRSFFCWLIIAAIVIGTLMATGVLAAGAYGSFR